MTIGPRSQCSTCARLVSPFSDQNTRGLEDAFCAAFPDGIPSKVFHNGLDHRQAVEGDHGIRWTPAGPGQSFPEWAFR